MAEIISDARIASMIAERKYLPLNWQQVQMMFRLRDGSAESFVNFTGADGTPFRILIRQKRGQPSDFSVILMAVLSIPIVPGKPEFRLLRYDGSGHDRRNTIEGNWIVGKPHIHRATERYQRKTSQRRPDGYAEETQRYRDLAGAWNSFCADVNLRFQ